MSEEIKVTEQAEAEVKEAAQQVSDAAKEIADTAKEAAAKVKEAAEAAKEKVGEALGEIREKAAEVVAEVKEKAAEAKEAVEEKAAEVKEAASEKVETMEDYKDELEASYRKIRPGDMVTGTVINVGDTDVTIDFNYYAPGRITLEELSDDPAFSLAESIKVGDTLTAKVLRTDDGAGSMLLSCKDAAQELAWDKLKTAVAEKKVYHGKISGAVKGGAVMYVEGIRGFIPASKLSLSYVEDTTPYLNQEMDVRVIEVHPENKRVILSARELLQEKRIAEKNAKINRFTVGTVLTGKVEQLKDYGAFVDLGDGISGLLHVSQISDRRLKHPNQVLKEGDEVKVKITKIADNRISLSMRAASEVTNREAADEGPREYSDGGEVTTGLGALLKNLKIGK